MSDIQMTLTGEERECLVAILETALKNTRIEEHRTRTPSYREHIDRQEQVIAGLLGKIQASAA